MDFDILNETITTQNTGLLTISSSGGLAMPSGNTAQRPSLAPAGTIRWNSASTILEYYNGTAWGPIGSGGVTSVGLSLPSIFTVTGSPVTSAGTLTGTLATQTAKTVFAGPAAGSAQPTFRTLSLAGGDISDVTISSPAINQVVAYDGTKWVNTGAVGSSATGQIGASPSAGGTAWTFISGNYYYADFVHNLGTTNLVVALYDTATGAIMDANSIVPQSATTLRVTAVGNARTIKIVAIANGQAIVAGGSTPSSVVVSQNGTTVNTATKLDFTGSSVLRVSDAGSGTATVSVGSRFTYFANSLDSPVNSDFIVNALAPTVIDPLYNALSVRSFSNTVEQGVSFLVSVPPGATTATFKIKGRAETAPGAVSVVQPRIYTRLIPNNAVIGPWSSAYELSNVNIPSGSANFQYMQQSVPLSSLSLVAGNIYQFELTRRVAGVTGTNLASPFLMISVEVELA